MTSIKYAVEYVKRWIIVQAYRIAGTWLVFWNYKQISIAWENLALSLEAYKLAAERLAEALTALQDEVAKKEAEAKAKEGSTDKWN